MNSALEANPQLPQENLQTREKPIGYRLIDTNGVDVIGSASCPIIAPHGALLTPAAAMMVFADSPPGMNIQPVKASEAPIGSTLIEADQIVYRGQGTLAA